MVVAGVMSGTSADGVDVALVKISPTKRSAGKITAGNDGVPRLKLLGHRGFAYPKPLRATLLRVMEGEALTAAEMSRLNWRLGEVYAECVEKTRAEMDVKIALVGVHGQTVYHQGVAARSLGGSVRATWQLGEAAILRDRLGVPVVSDFRAADLAAGGQGAPLVPMLDYCMFRSLQCNRILLNLGGIANVTVLPQGAELDAVLAFDTGPANMVCDALMQRGFGKAFDREGRTAARGKVLQEVVSSVLREGYFNQQPPKSCGREQFGAEFAERFARLCREADGSAADAMTSAAELTILSIADAVERFCKPRLGTGRTELVAAGGGTRNRWMMARLQQRFSGMGIQVTSIDALGVESQAKEAVAFALLAWLSWHGLPGNVPSATGARRAAVLGKVSL